MTESRAVGGPGLTARFRVGLDDYGIRLSRISWAGRMGPHASVPAVFSPWPFVTLESASESRSQ